MKEPNANNTFDSNEEIDDDLIVPANDSGEAIAPPAASTKTDLHKIRRSIEDRLERRRLREMQDLPFDDDDFDLGFDEDKDK
ncbi:MAG: hypothetical protein K0R12_598 [Gammaproteobacteria bacterium]|nr:hypothetical protein [Gammaproteobacteria bacterium]